MFNTINKIMGQNKPSRMEDHIKPTLRPDEADSRPTRTCIDHVIT